MLVVASVSVLSVVVVWWSVGLVKTWANFDGLYYVVVGKTWYDKELIAANFSFPLPLEYYPAHFPLYPGLIWIVAKTGLINFPNAMLAVNLGAGTLCAMFLVFLSQKYKIFENPLWFGLIWLFWWPRIWAVRSIGSPETLFVMLVMGSLFFFDQKKYWWSAVAGSLAMLTKSPGILLFIAYLWQWRKQAWPVLMIPITLMGLFGFYYLKTGDFWAYFNSGDNIHLQLVPFKVFDASQFWVGTFWLEDVVWIYLLAGLGVWSLYKKNRVFGSFGAVFFATILFVSHRDISRYALPLSPLVIWGLSDAIQKKEVRIALLVGIIPIAAYTINFVANNFALVGNWTPLL
jgi:hypothetical protein